jgi:hypothetical protein
MKLRAQRNKKLPDTRETYDLVCEEGDDFDLNDLVGSLKKEQLPPEVTTAFTTTSYTPSTSIAPPKDSEVKSKSDIPSSSSDTFVPNPTLESVANSNSSKTSTKEVIAVDDEKLHKKLEAQLVSNKSTIVKSEGRMVGESKNAYSKRVKQETRQIIQRANQQAHNPEKRLKKKEFLTMKKKNGKKRKNKFINDNDDNDVSQVDDDNDNQNEISGKLLTGEQAVAARERATRVQFGEQAERPPNFTQLPRGANPIGTMKKPKLTSSSTNIRSQQEIDAEALAMDRIRMKVQAQYAEIKARRRNNGDFHL